MADNTIIPVEIAELEDFGSIDATDMLLVTRANGNNGHINGNVFVQQLSTDIKNGISRETVQLTPLASIADIHAYKENGSTTFVTAKAAKMMIDQMSTTGSYLDLTATSSQTVRGPVEFSQRPTSGGSLLATIDEITGGSIKPPDPSPDIILQYMPMVSYDESKCDTFKYFFVTKNATSYDDYNDQKLRSFDIDCSTITQDKKKITYPVIHRVMRDAVVNVTLIGSGATYGGVFIYKKQNATKQDVINSCFANTTNDFLPFYACKGDASAYSNIVMNVKAGTLIVCFSYVTITKAANLKSGTQMLVPNFNPTSSSYKFSASDAIVIQEFFQQNSSN